jgi:head-tail adaptor
MKLQQMIDQIKKHHPELGTNEIIHLLNQASDEFCQRTLILDEATQFDTVADQRFYGLKDSILEVKSVDLQDADGNVKEIKRLIGRPEYRDIT